MMIPDPGIIVIEVIRHTTDPGATEADGIRQIGTLVGVAGVVLAIPDGIAAVWLWVKNWPKRVLADRITWHSKPTTGQGGSASGKPTMGGNAYADKWQAWSEDAKDDEKVNILHHQVEILRDLIYEQRKDADRTAQKLSNDIRVAEGRVTRQLRLLESEISGERSQTSRVDARGFGPIALGIIMTGVPDELAAVTWVGRVFVVVAVFWIIWAFPGWWRDYKQALEYDIDSAGARADLPPSRYRDP